jgi:hypothetical protein
MRSIFLLSLFSVFVSSVHSQKSDEKLIELGKTHKNIMFLSEPTKKDIKDLKTGLPEDLQIIGHFIKETITAKTLCLQKIF